MVGCLKIVEILIKVPSFNKTVADFLNFNGFRKLSFWQGCSGAKEDLKHVLKPWMLEEFTPDQF